MPLGRPPAGPRIARKLDGEPTAKQRLEAILATVAGETTNVEASEHLGISQGRFYLLRDRALQAALTSLEPRPGGRPRKPAPTADELRVRELETEVTRLKQQVETAEVRVRTQLLLPPRSSPSTGKKTPRSSTPRRRNRRTRPAR